MADEEIAAKLVHVVREAVAQIVGELAEREAGFRVVADAPAAERAEQQVQAIKLLAAVLTQAADQFNDMSRALERLMKTPTRHDRSLDLAADVLRLAPALVAQANEQLKQRTKPLAMRDDVMVAWARKIDAAFEALVDDAKLYRGEAMHHLKTISESFIYFCVVGADESDVTAKGLLAQAYYRKELFYSLNRDAVAGAEDHRNAWAAQVAKLTDDGTSRLNQKLEQLAKQPRVGMGAWYDRVYRLACEPAHIADLSDFMPIGGVMDFGSPVTTAHQADDALFYGLHIMLEVGHALVKASELQLVAPIEVLMRHLDEIAGTTIAKTAGYDALPNDASGSDSEAP